MTALILMVVMLVVALVAYFYAPPAPYTYGLRVVGAVCVLLLFLIAVGVLRL